MSTNTVSNDFNKWEESIETYSKMEAQKNADEEGYKNRLKEYDVWAAGIKDPMERIQVLLVDFLMNSNTNATMFGVGDDQIGVTGATLDISTKGNQAITDIGSMVLDKSKDPKSVKDFAMDLDHYLHFLDTKVNTPGSIKLEPSELNTIRTNILQVRHMINYPGDPSPYFKPEYNGGADALMNPDEPTTVINPADPTPPKHVNIQTFHDLFAMEASKSSILQGAASGGVKLETNALSTVQTNFGGINQGVKVKLDGLTKQQKTELGFYDTGALHMIMDVIKSAVSQQARG